MLTKLSELFGLRAQNCVRDCGWTSSYILSCNPYRSDIIYAQRQLRNVFCLNLEQRHISCLTENVEIASKYLKNKKTMVTFFLCIHNEKLLYCLMLFSYSFSSLFINFSNNCCCSVADSFYSWRAKRKLFRYKFNIPRFDEEERERKRLDKFRCLSFYISIAEKEISRADNSYLNL